MTRQRLSGRVGLIGAPVAHSLSPAFQQPAFDAYGGGIVYELWPTPSAEIPERVEMLRSGRAFGANVTVPHKPAFADLVDTRSELAGLAGAVNTVVARDGRLHGENTDIHGFLTPLRERSIELRDSKVVVVGAGGAARGVVVALLTSGVAEIALVNRTLERAEAIASLDPSRIVPFASHAAADAAGGASVIVNATSIGWADSESVVDATVFSRLSRDALAYDLTYRETAFLRLASTCGIATLDGLEMLVHQGARSFELWTATPAPVDLMMTAARAARAARGG